MSNIDDSTLYEIITGRVEPYIYSFETNTLPNMLKVGDTYRPVEERLNEWRRHYKDLSEVSRHRAIADGDTFFRDHSVHKYLESKGVQRSPIDESRGIHSKEFFHDIGEPDVAEAVQDVVDSYGIPGKYAYYDHLKDRVEQRYARNKDFSPRDNQQTVINNFTNAVNNGRTNLLMYAVMRFGKSITSMWCAKQLDSKLTIIVSAKADVRSEWKQTVESHKDFTGYRFIDGADVTSDTDLSKIYDQPFQTGGGELERCTNIVIFFTLQDLAGSTDEIKARHQILEGANPDLLIIDETHFGARAQVLGKILAGVQLTDEDEDTLKDTDGVDDLGRIGKLEAINAKVKLHLSGTPYRILMGSEFEKEDIIAFVQFSDIYESKIQWRENNLDQDEWHNPYYGFPQMIRFAFNPNESSRKKLESIPGSKPSEIFAPVDTSRNGDYETFKHEQEAIDLLQVLDGSKDDSQLLGILDHESIKSGKLARHMVIVLPNKASCDALERLINDRGDLFKNLSDYKILNLAGHNTSFRNIEAVKSAIVASETAGQKTVSLTVNKMLTGTTVPQWDTMIYLKGTASPQEYDQAIFRLQSPWVETYVDESTGETIKYDMKPQTLLVDLDPTRMFYLQEIKAFTYGANTHEIGNENIERFIKRELKVSPVLALNAENNKLVEIEASRIIDAVRKYSSERSITDDVNDISVDISLRDNEDIYNVISRLSELGSRGGLDINPTDDDEGQELDGEPSGENGGGEESDQSSGSSTDDNSGKDDSGIKTFEKQFRTYYVRILLFAFLSETNERSLTDLIENLDANNDNRRIAKSLGLAKDHLIALRENINWSTLSSLDYKIQNSDFRANDETISPVEHIEIAINKFGKISDAEVFTPSFIVDKMYDVFDDDFWGNIKSHKILDIASKSGNFAHGFIKKAQQYSVSIDDIKDNFYSIPTSPAAYEFTLKMYQALGLNTDNIARHFTSYDLVEAEEPLNLLNIDKRFCDITTQDLALDGKIVTDEDEGAKVKFGAIVGNPPYQEDNSGNNRDNPIYPDFIDSSYSLSDLVALITPGRFLFNAGQTSKSWNKKMLNNPHVKVEYFNQKSSEVFKSTDIKGGIAITLYDKSKDIGPIGTFTHMPELTSIANKVESMGALWLSQIVQPQGIYRFSEKFFDKFPKAESMQGKGTKSKIVSRSFSGMNFAFLDKQDSQNDIKMLGLVHGGRIYKWINKQYVATPESFSKWKVLLPESNGSGTLGETLSSPIVGKPYIAHTDTFLTIGGFDSEVEAENCLKYIKSKFARAMLGILKITQHNSRSAWQKVPIQDFTLESDIDWSKSVSEIDKQLYAKYELDEDEINFIESKVRAME